MNNNLLSFDHRMKWDGHGGRAEEHREEMESIARRIYEEEREKLIELMYETAYKAYKQAIEDFLHALEYDIESVVSIGFGGCREIFEDKKTQKFVSDYILKEVQKHLNGKNFRK